MLPYIRQPTLSLGPLTIHAFGVMVAIAVIVGAAFVKRRARLDGLDSETAMRLVTWVVVAGFLGAHLVDRFVYFPAATLADPWSVLRPWEGLSSFGGFLGGAIGAALFVRRARLGSETWRYVDAVAYGLPFGWVFGRIGCFLAYDHPGAPTSFFLGEVYEDGIVRHNLGLEEGLYTIPVAALFWALGRRRRPAGFFTGLLAVVYAPVRFTLDFLRIVDVRYLGLTPGQYGAAALLAAGLFVLARSGHRTGAPIE